MNINDFYSEIEQITKIKTHFSFPDLSGLSTEDYLKFRIEYFVLNLYAPNNISETFRENCDDVIKYLCGRVETTNNPLLKGKYCEYLYLLSNNNTHCRQAVDYYQLALSIAFEQAGDNHYELNVDRIFEKIIYLSFKIKYNIDSLRKQIIQYKSDPDIPNRLKTRLFISLKDVKIFRKVDCSDFPEFFISLAELSSENIWVEHNLNLAKEFAQKIEDNDIIKRVYELLGDNEMNNLHPADDSNLAIPHLNEAIYEKAISYYKMAKCTDKLSSAYKLHNKNKINKKYIPIKIPSKLDAQFYELLDSQIESISNMTSSQVMLNLIFGMRFLFYPVKDIYLTMDKSKDYYYKKLFTPVQSDINSNHKQVNDLENDFYQIYSHSMRLSVDFILRSILNCINNKKLSYTKLRSFLLNKTIMGVSIEERGYNYSWFQHIELGLKEFFKQLSLLRRGKESDWRICTDILSLKFEAILRSMFINEDVNVTKFKKGNTSMCLLEDMLRLDKDDLKIAFYKYFNDDDLALFNYAFSSKAQCLNMRNNVAHCFYLPQDYNAFNATIAFIAILRLAKYYPTITDDKDM